MRGFDASNNHFHLSYFRYVEKVASWADHKCTDAEETTSLVRERSLPRGESVCYAMRKRMAGSALRYIEDNYALSFLA
jgi:hypothetical protein